MSAGQALSAAGCGGHGQTEPGGDGGGDGGDGPGHALMTTDEDWSSTLLGGTFHTNVRVAMPPGGSVTLPLKASVPATEEAPPNLSEACWAGVRLEAGDLGLCLTKTEMSCRWKPT